MLEVIVGAGLVPAHFTYVDKSGQGRALLLQDLFDAEALRESLTAPTLRNGKSNPRRFPEEP